MRLTHFIRIRVQAKMARTLVGCLTLWSACGICDAASLSCSAPVRSLVASARDAIAEAQPEPGAASKPPAKKGVLAVPDGVKVVRDIEYARVNGRTLLLDMYLPEQSAAEKAPASVPNTQKPERVTDKDAAPAPKVEPAKPPAALLFPVGMEAFGEAPESTATKAPDVTDAPRPVVIWIHGGGWESGTKDASPAARLVPFGYAAVSISYRFTQVAPYPAQIHDCKAAVRWVRAHAKEYNLDADNIGVWGASAGGHLVALLGTTAGEQELEGDVGGNLDQSSAVQAVCDWFGPTDLIKLCRMASGENAEEAAQPRPDLVVPKRKAVEAVAVKEKATEPVAASDAAPITKKRPKVITPSPLRKLLGGMVQDKLDVAVLANPITFVDKSDAPVFIVHGDSDSLVPLDQSTLFKSALERAGVSVGLHIVKGGGHGFWNDELFGMVRAFFDEKLKPPATEKLIEKTITQPAAR